MKRQTSVAMPEITPSVDIDKIYRQLKHLRKTVKQAESLRRKPARFPVPELTRSADIKLNKRVLLATFCDWTNPNAMTVSYRALPMAMDRRSLFAPAS